MAAGSRKPDSEDRYFDDDADREMRRVLRERAAESEKKKRRVPRMEQVDRDFAEDNFRIAILLVIIVGFAGLLGLIVRFFVR